MEKILTRLPEHAESLSAALITSSHSPLLMLNGDLKIVAASKSFGETFELDIASITNQLLADIGEGEWNVPQLHSLLRATVNGDAAIDVYELDLVRTGKKICRLVVNAHKLDYSDAGRIRVVLAVTDVTALRLAERAKDELVRDKQLLLHELQHRVANSLQIIASVLLQSARKVQSNETREHLQDAHHRVMSIATLQKQLSKAAVTEVDLRNYFIDLCSSIGASMIGNPDQLSLVTNVDDSVVDPDTSVSLGLITTELVINSLKHAFPGRTQVGKISVDYHADGSAWTLTVSDDGVGMPKDEEDRKPGLGTGIVEALATQLDAVVSVADQAPGTKVSVTHI